MMRFNLLLIRAFNFIHELLDLTTSHVIFGPFENVRTISIWRLSLPSCVLLFILYIDISRALLHVSIAHYHRSSMVVSKVITEAHQ